MDATVTRSSSAPGPAEEGGPVGIPIAWQLAVDKKQPVPLYRQLKDSILRMINDGTLIPGTMLPSEAELCQALKVSRPTTRQALAELAIEGYVTKAQGRGTFVSHPRIEGRFLSKLQTFADEIRQDSMTPSTRVLGLEVSEGIPHVNDRLGLPLSAPIVAIKRLRFADGVPVVFVETYLPYRLVPGMLDTDLEEHSLYETLERQYGLRVSRVTRVIEAAASTPREAELLLVKQGAPICLVKTVGYTDKTGGPVEFSVARYRGDMTTFSVELYR